MFSRFIFRSLLEEGEHIVLVFRRPMVFLMAVLKWRVLLYGGIAFGLWYLQLYAQWYLWHIAAAFAAYKLLAGFLAWYTRAILMTNEGLIFVYWPRFFYRRSDRVEWCHLDEVQVERIGVRAFAFNYGTLTFKKLKAGKPIIERGIARPGKVARQVEHFRELMMDEKNFMEESALKDLLSQMVVTHVDKNGQPERPEESKFRRLQERMAKEKGEGGQQTIDNSQQTVEEQPVETKKPQKRSVTEGEDMAIEKELDDTGGVGIDLQ